MRRNMMAFIDKTLENDTLGKYWFHQIREHIVVD